RPEAASPGAATQKLDLRLPVKKNDDLRSEQSRKSCGSVETHVDAHAQLLSRFRMIGPMTLVTGTGNACHARITQRYLGLSESMSEARSPGSTCQGSGRSIPPHCILK